MNMRDRILKIMEREGLTPSKFAESIGIQRSAMSHIISGRNNPSLDVLLKILELAIVWQRRNDPRTCVN